MRANFGMCEKHTVLRKDAISHITTAVNAFHDTLNNSNLPAFLRGIVQTKGEGKLGKIHEGEGR